MSKYIFIQRHLFFSTKSSLSYAQPPKWPVIGGYSEKSKNFKQYIQEPNYSDIKPKELKFKNDIISNSDKKYKLINLKNSNNEIDNKKYKLINLKNSNNEIDNKIKKKGNLLTKNLISNSPQNYLNAFPFIIKKRIGVNIIDFQTSFNNTHSIDWLSVFTNLYENGGLKNIPVSKIKKFIKVLRYLPLENHLNVIPILKKIIDEANIPFDQSIFTCFVKYYSYAGDFNSAKKMIHLMHSSSIPINASLFQNLLIACLKTSNIFNALSTIKLAAQYNVKLPLNVYLTFLNVCLKTKASKEAFSIFENLKFMALEYQPNLNIYNNMIKICSIEAGFEKAYDLFKEMQNRPIDPLTPNSETYNSLLMVCCHYPEYSNHFLSVLEEMRAKGYKISQETFSCLLVFNAKKGNINYVRKLIISMCKSSQISPSSINYTSLMNAYANYKPNIKLSNKQLNDSSDNNNLNIISNSSTIQLPPFLPISNLRKGSEIIKESDDIFNYLKQNYPNLITSQIMTCVLKISMNIGNKKQFIEKVNTQTISPIIEFPNIFSDSFNDQFQNFNKDNISYINSSNNFYNNKFIRNHNIYITIMTFAIKIKSTQFAENLYKEYKLWKNSPYYMQLNDDTKDFTDLLINAGLIKVYSLNDQLDNAVSIIQSCQIKKWPQGLLAVLYSKAKLFERPDVIKTLSTIVKKDKTRL